MKELTALERAIVSVLQIDPRASWRKVAEVLGESERTVSRRGTELLAEGLVSVVGIRPEPASVIAQLTCSPGTARAAAASLAQRPDTTFAYTVSGSGDVVAELLIPPARLSTLLSEELPATIGLTHATSYPVLHYFRTIRGWHPHPLTPAQVSALQARHTVDTGRLDTASPLDGVDTALVEALCADGRATFEALGRRANVAESTARRRIDWILGTDQVQLRVVVEPALLGLPTEALLWIRVNPALVEAVGEELARDRRVRYAAAVAGDCQIVADVAVEDPASLFALVTASTWARQVERVETTLVLEARKRGGLRLAPPAW
ncbi:hypothetical protein GCM10023081_43490 [Arthrobacter ginkgonis]|uniref:AsnC family transcriptional regulator n=1 Tax=Arthrobacter ginkgonis TaxID=1630594 RepID=A0ABP7DC06_9MICC